MCIYKGLDKWIWIKHRIISSLFNVRQISYTLNIIYLQYIQMNQKYFQLIIHDIDPNEEKWFHSILSLCCCKVTEKKKPLYNALLIWLDSIQISSCMSTNCPSCYYVHVTIYLLCTCCNVVPCFLLLSTNCPNCFTHICLICVVMLLSCFSNEVSVLIHSWKCLN